MSCCLIWKLPPLFCRSICLLVPMWWFRHAQKRRPFFACTRAATLQMCGSSDCSRLCCCSLAACQACLELCAWLCSLVWGTRAQAPFVDIAAWATGRGCVTFLRLRRSSAQYSTYLKLYYSRLNSKQLGQTMSVFQNIGFLLIIQNAIYMVIVQQGPYSMKRHTTKDSIKAHI